MSLVTDLQEARELISNKTHWCQGDFAQNLVGTRVNPLHPDACRWCALGAARMVCNYNETALSYTSPRDKSRYTEVLRALRIEEKSVVEVNDTEGYDSVMAIYDKAISNAKGQA